MEFCEGIESWEGAALCGLNDTQRPCHSCKMSYWQTESPLQLAKSAVPNRYRQAHGKKRIEDGTISPPPAGPSEASIAMDHAIPKDERGLPFLDKNLSPMTAKEISNMGSKFDEGRRNAAQGRH